MKKVLTKPVVYSLYGLSILLMFLGFLTLGTDSNPKEIKDPSLVFNILSKITLPTFNKEDLSIGRPYQDENIVIVQRYYDYKGKEEDQRQSLIYFGDTYIQSRGVSYQLTPEDGFYVVAVLAGEVTEVKTDELIGNRITVKHSENVYSIYQSLDEINVSVGDEVDKGMILGKSGTSNINSGLKTHLYFELLIDNIYVNPEEYYDKTL